MGPLIKGVFFGLIGAVFVAPIVLVLAIFGLPFIVAGGIVLGVFFAIPMLLLAALTIPFLILAALAAAAVVVTVVLAAKVAVFIVLPIVLVALVVSWFARGRERHHAMMS
jgi:hypothetical protein